MEKDAKRTVKDSLFTFIFKELKYQRQLYASFYDDEKECKDEDFHLVTLENIMIDDVYNDLGLMVKDKLIILLEAQSTFNPNMAIRFLIYLGKTYMDYIERNNINIYGSKRITLPTPEFIVVYTGESRLDVESLKLSDSYFYEGIPPIELNVKIINIENVKENILKEYILFCRKLSELQKGTKTEEDKFEALKRTVRYCIENDILKELLLSREREVENIMMTVFSQEKALEMMLLDRYNEGWNEGRNEGWNEGRNEGRSEGEKLIAGNMKKNGMPIELIVKLTNLKKEEVEKI